MVKQLHKYSNEDNAFDQIQYFFSKTNSFQQNVVHQWDPFENHVAELIILRVYLHDEITTDGYSKCIIELLTLHGILVRINRLHDTNSNLVKWILHGNDL